MSNLDAIKETHPDYKKALPLWTLMRDVVAGQQAVHDKAETYLPRLKKETDQDYAARKDRALFYNATRRTINGLGGLLFRKPPQIEVSSAIEELLDDITLSGLSLNEFAEQVAAEALTVSRFGVLVDYPTVPEGLTKKDIQDFGYQPSMNLYKAESIRNWKIGKVNGRRAYTQVILGETVTVDITEFESKSVTQYRVLDLVDGNYRQRIYQEDAKGKVFQVKGDIFPLLNGNMLNYIPLYMYPDLDIYQPVMLDLANVNISHYKTTASYEHGCHLSGLPTMFTTGHQPAKDAKIYIGGATANCLPEEGANAFYVEVTNKLEALESNLNRKESIMAILGSRMLEVQKKAAEAAETASTHRVGENATLATSAQLISKVVKRSLVTYSEWAGVGDVSDVSFSLNRDFQAETMTPQMITALLASVQAGKMSDEAFFQALQKGEIHPEDVGWEEEQGRISIQGLGNVGNVDQLEV